MVEKVQKPILGAILTVSVIILIVFFAFIWGRVILIKNVDTNRLNTMILNLELLDRAIRNCAETRQTQNVEIDLNYIEMFVGDDTFFEQTTIQMNTITTTPVISFVSWVPINTKSLPFTVDRYVQYFNPSTSFVSCFVGLEGEVKTNTIRMNDIDYTFYAMLTEREECPIFVCLKNDKEPLDCANNCGCEADVLYDGNESYLITFVNEYAIEFGGKMREKVGVSGRDIQGVVMGKAKRYGGENLNSISLVYRPMTDGTTKSKIILTCPGDCYTSGGMKNTRISYASSLTEGDTTYHNLILSITG